MYMISSNSYNMTIFDIQVKTAPESTSEIKTADFLAVHVENTADILFYDYLFRYTFQSGANNHFTD